MDVTELVAQTMERTRQSTLRMVEGLTASQLRWQPGPEANPIGFLLFHIFRAEDRYAHRWMSSKGEVWFREGWASRYKLPVQPPDQESPLNSGNSWTPQQVADQSDREHLGIGVDRRQPGRDGIGTRLARRASSTMTKTWTNKSASGIIRQGLHGRE